MENRNLDFWLYGSKDATLTLKLCKNHYPHQPCTFCADLKSANQRVEELAESLELALRDREEMLNRRNSHHSAFSCIPAEVVCRIFAECFPPTPTPNEFFDDSNWPYHALEEVRTFAFGHQRTLGAVCRSWRDIIWSNPLFWNFVSVRITQRTPSGFATLFRQWLDRSDTLPLTIRLAYTLDIREEVDKSIAQSLMSPLIPILNDSIHRWSSISFHIPTSYMSKLRYKSRKLPPLKVLILSPVDDRPAHLRQYLVDWKQDAVFRLGSTASPSHLKVRYFRMENLRISWNTLLRFEGDHLLLDEAVDVLLNSPLLSDCNFHVDDKRRPFYRSTKLVLNNLTKLCLTGDAEPLFSRLTCPSLRSMKYDASGAIGNSILLEPTQFLIRSGCALEYIEIEGLRKRFSADDNDLVSLLSIIPSLRSLSLGGSIGPELFKRLGETAFSVQDNHIAPFLPNLEIFEYDGGRDFAWSSIAAMVPLHPPSPQYVLRRPLSEINIRIQFNTDGADEEASSEEIVALDEIEQHDVETFLDILEAGINLLIDDEDCTDVITFWKNHYKL